MIPFLSLIVLSSGEPSLVWGNPVASDLESEGTRVSPLDVLVTTPRTSYLGTNNPGNSKFEVSTDIAAVIIKGVGSAIERNMT